MIIKSHVRGGFKEAASYLKAQGENEKVRLVEISDPDADSLDEAFQNMWTVAIHSKATKPIHHISINPSKDERLTDKQVQKIVERCEQKYGYKPDDHQRVIVEHIKDGRQHFHVMWNRVSLSSGKAVWPGLHWKKSKQAAREMEAELGLKRPVPKRMKRIRHMSFKAGRRSKALGRYQGLSGTGSSTIKTTTLPGSKEQSQPKAQKPNNKSAALPVRQVFRPSMHKLTARIKRPPGKYERVENIPDSEKMKFKRPEWDTAELIAWAMDNGRLDILADYGFDFSAENFEP